MFLIVCALLLFYLAYRSSKKKKTNRLAEIEYEEHKKAELLRKERNEGFTKIHVSYENGNKIEIDEDDGKIKHFHSKIAGVTHKNKDGTSRQEALEYCGEGQKLNLIQTPTEKYPEAISIFAEGGDQLGFVTATLAPKINELLNCGKNLECVITDMTSSDGYDDEDDKTIAGCNIKIRVLD